MKDVTRTREEVLERSQQLAAMGYTLCSGDNPERGMRGILAFRVQENGEEVSEMLEWPIFQGPLVPDVAEVLPEELAQFISSGSRHLALCDDPSRLRLGFVRYYPEEGRAVVRQTRLTLVKGANAPTKAVILGVRDELLAAQRQP